MARALIPFGYHASKIFNGSIGPLPSGVDSPFVAWLKALVPKRFDSYRAFVRVAEKGRSEGGAMGYLSKVLKGKKPPPLEHVRAWGKALGLEGSELERFVELAELAHAPDAVAKRYLAMEARVKKAEAELDALIRDLRQKKR